MKTTPAIDSAIQKYAELMIKNITNIKKGWQKSWITTGFKGAPINISGKVYHGSNPIALTLLCMNESYQMPVFMTFKQCKEQGLMVNKGAKGFPVLFWKMIPRNTSSGNNITIGDYNNLPQTGKNDYKLIPFLKYYLVFNIAQTNCEQAKPELWAKFKESFYNGGEIATDTDGMYENEHLDKLINGGWLCKITCKEQDSAFYRKSTDEIVLPLKRQFKRGKTAEDIYADGQEFYSTAIHEMIHSTGAKGRLNRTFGSFGDNNYAHEELVAELSAAFIGNNIGFKTEVQENNAAYLDAWLAICKEKPNELLKILGHVDKAVSLFNERYNKQA